MDDKSWRPARNKYGVAIANFDGKVTHGLCLTVGDPVHILEEYGTDTHGWYRGVSLQKKELKGVFPKVLIKEKECEVDNPGCYETITPSEDLIVQELTFGLSEWLQKWKSKYLEMGPCSMIQKVRKTMIELTCLRSRLLQASVSTEQKQELKEEIVALIDWGNGQLGMDLVPRKEGEQLDTDKTSIIELHRVHIQSADNARSAEPRRGQVLSELRNSKETVSVQNILVLFRSSQCNIGEVAFIYVSIYNSKDEKFISEQFEIEVNKNGLPANQEKIDSLCALFTDISSEEMSRNLYLVARMYRYGKMLSDNNSKKTPQTPYKRPWGVGVLNLEEVRHMSANVEYYESMIKVQSCVDNEGAFSEMHRTIINKQSNLGSSSKLGVGVVPSPDKQNLGITVAVRILSGELKSVQTENPVLFTKGVAIIQKLDFSDIITPGEVRNDLYITLTEGSFEKDGKKSAKNVEVTVTVYDTAGTKIKGCISYGTKDDKDGMKDSFCSGTYYHNNNPKWGETIRVSIPMDVFPGSHVRFDIFHCSRNTSRGKAEKRLCGFAYMRLTDSAQIVIQDASHTLCVYKCEDVSKIQYKKYQTLPFLADDFNDPHTSAFQQGGKNANLAYPKTKENITVTTKLCSTKFTQTSQLLGILQWKERRNEIESNLDQMMKLQGLEIMKFLQDILDKIFDMLSQGASSNCSYCTKVFHALVFILNLLLDSRFENFIPVLDNYLQARFSFPVVHKHLIECFAQGIRKAVSGDHFPVAMSLKVLDQLVRFIVRSRELEQSASMYNRNSDPESQFMQRIKELFDSFCALLSNKESRLKISQMALLANLSKSFLPFSSVLSKPQIAHFVVPVLNQKQKDVPDDVARNKMEFINEIINSELFLDQESRAILLPLCLSQIRLCLTEKVFLQLATTSLGDVLDKIFYLKMKGDARKDISKVSESLFRIMIETTYTLNDKVIPVPSVPGSAPTEVPVTSTPIKTTPDIEEEEGSNTLKQRKLKERRRTLTQGFQFPFTTTPNKGRPPSTNIQCQLPLTLVTSSSSSKLPLTDISSKLVDNASTSKQHETPRRKGTYVSMDDLGISGEMIACLAEMLRLMDERHYRYVITIDRQPANLRDFLSKVLLTFQELIKDDIFPSDWTSMRLVTNNVIFTAVEYFSDTLRTYFLEGDKFNAMLWNHYFNLAVSFITQGSLQLERFSSAKRQKIKERYQDMRVLMGQQIQMLWETLGCNRRHFIPSMIGPFLKVTLVPEEDLRKATLPIFFDMMESEQRINGHFLLVENEIIEKLDQYITVDSYGDDAYKDLFKKTLLDKVQTEPELQDKGSQFILSVTSLLERLLDYRQVYDGDENRDKRMHCTFNILNFYKDNNNREEMYIRYIKKLYDLHLSAHNYVEAGLTLQLYAQILRWVDNQRKDELEYPQQAEWERKEKVYLQIIDCFDKGRVWEYGIPLCKELAKLYERRLDYRKLSNILERQAKFFSNILDGIEVVEEGLERPVFYPRQEPTYFRVSYFGQSFPPFVRNKAFIYRGDECLKLQDIINHLTQEFPMATIMSSNNPVDDSKKQGDTQYIQICNVKPLADDRPEFVKCGGSVPSEVKNFYNSNDVDTFQFDRSFHRGEKDKNCEFKTLCTERTIMRTSYKFPGILQWYEVVHTETINLTPVYTAIENIRNATQLLQKEIDKCQKNSSMDTVKSLSMKLQGMISANVNGGIPKYQEAFFLPEYVFLHPEEADGVNQLKQLITEQVICLDKGMTLMKTVNKVRSAGIGDLLKNLSDILKDIKRSVGMNPHDRTSAVNSTTGDFSRTTPRPDSGRGSMLFESGSLDPSGSASQLSSGSNRSSVLSADALSQEGDINSDESEFPVLSVTMAGSDSNLNRPVDTGYHKGQGLSSSTSTGNLDRPPAPPRILRNTSAPSVSYNSSETPKPIVQRRATDLGVRTKPIVDTLKPELPPKVKPAMEKIPEKLSVNETSSSSPMGVVPPLPPRKGSRVSQTVANFSAMNSSPEPQSFHRRGSPSTSNSSLNDSDSSLNVFDAPPIPSRKSHVGRSPSNSDTIPPIPAPRTSIGKEDTKM